MNRGWILILLVSLGLNLGLGLRVLRDEDGRGSRRSRGEGRMGERFSWPAPGDTAAMRRLGDRRLERVTDRLGLAPAQAEALRANQRAAMQRLADRRTAIEEGRDAVRTLLAADPVDQAAVRAALGELGRRQAELDSLVTETILADLAILDPDQRERYLRLHPYGLGGHGGGRHGGGRGPRGP